MLDGPTDAGVFKILVQAFLSGGNAQQEKGKDFIYSLSRIKRALLPAVRSWNSRSRLVRTT